MKLIGKLFRHKTTVLAALIMYFLFLHAAFIPCCPCSSGRSHVYSCDPEHNHNEHLTGTHKQKMNVSAMPLLSISIHNHVCGCEKIMVSNYLVEENESSYKNIKPVRYHFSFAHFGETIPFSSGLSSHIQHSYSPRFGTSTIQSIRTVVLLV